MTFNAAWTARRRARDCACAGRRGSRDFAEGQIDPVRTNLRVTTVGQGRDAVVPQTVGAAPDDDIAMPEGHAHLLVGPLRAPEQESRWQAERDGHDRMAEVPLVAVLVQRQSRAGIVPIHEAGIRYELRKAGLARRVGREPRKWRGHRRPTE